MSGGPARSVSGVARRRRVSRRGAAAGAWLTAALAFGVCAAAGEPVALGPAPGAAGLAGEELRFVIRWGAIPAGRATLSVEPLSDARLLLRATAESLEWLDWIYPVRNRVESIVRLPLLTSEELIKNTKEGRGRARVERVLFDGERHRAHHTRDGVHRPPIEVPADTRDALAGFYAFRAFHSGPEPRQLAISDGKRVIESTVRVVAREDVKTPAGTFTAIKIEPSVEGIGGIFKQSRGARILIWLTDDDRRYPVRLESKVAIGRVTAELTAFGPEAITDER